MTHLPLQRRTLALLAVVLPLLALFVYVAVRSGPLAPVAVTAITVQEEAITPALFGTGTVEARYTYKIGPTYAGRVMRLDVQVGDRVAAGQVLGEMDPVDLDDRIRAAEAGLKRAQAVLREAEARNTFAQAQARRYEGLRAEGLVSEEMFAAKLQERQIAEAALAGAREEIARLQSDRQALRAQRANLRLTAPVDGLVIARAADPGTTVVAGQPVVEVIDPTRYWIDTRFDQISANGLQADLNAHIVLRSRSNEHLAGRVLRVEPRADAVTEETLAKVVFAELPQNLPPLGELAEVTVALPALPAAPVIPNAAIKRIDGRLGVWLIRDGELAFTPVALGASDLDGRVQVRRGVKAGDRVVVHSGQALSTKSRIHVVERLTKASP
ncbi:MAG: efflux RND transporter periplasmic adaptor subunit [Gammaproteobacteria bacterium]|nr:efflux RND transporter periplasmic adaptor subunit [Gammaproteobacteria bacterium]